MACAVRTISSRFLSSGSTATLTGRQLGVEAQHHALLAPDLLLAVGVGQEGEQRPVHARRRLDDVGHDVLLALLVEVGQRLAAELGVLLEVEVGAVGDALSSLQPMGNRYSMSAVRLA